MLHQRGLGGGQRQHQDFIIGKIGYLTALEASTKFKRLWRATFVPMTRRMISDSIKVIRLYRPALGLILCLD
jgi:hypothetical protein